MGVSFGCVGAIIEVLSVFAFQYLNNFFIDMYYRDYFESGFKDEQTAFVSINGTQIIDFDVFSF